MLHRSLCACALSLLPVTVPAGPDSVAVLLGSYHMGADRSLALEEFNPGVFVNWHGAALSGRLDLGFGAFRNSYDGASVAVNAAYPLVRTPD